MANIPITEKQRQLKYYKWEGLCKSLKNQVEGIPIKDIPLPVIAKAMNNIALAGEQGGEAELLNSFNVAININGAETTLPYKDLHRFVMNKALTQNTQMGLSFDKIKVVGTGENPYHHPLTKSLGITPFDEEFLTQHSILSKALYDHIVANPDAVLDNDVLTLGSWNVDDIEKAIKSLNQYTKVRKLVHRNGKTYIGTYYVSKTDPTDVQTDTEEEVADHQDVHDVVKTGLEVGDDIEIEVNGKMMKATIRRFEPDGSVRLLLEDGKKTNKNIIDFAKMVKQGKITLKGKHIQQPNLNAASTFPTSLKDLTVTKNLGGSTGADLAVDKDGNQWVIKKGGNADQAANEVLANKMYRLLGINAPECDLVEGAMVSKFIGNVNDLNASNPVLEDTLRTQLDQHFAIHALMANYDVVENDNTKYDPVNGQIWHLDNGGTLQFRAQGQLKRDFDGSVTQLTSMRNSTGMQQKWFGKVSDGDIAAQIDNMIVPKRKEILDLVNNSDLPKALRTKLHKTMEERLDYLDNFVKQYNQRSAGVNQPIKVDISKMMPSDIVKANTKANNYGTLDMTAVQKTMDDYKKTLPKSKQQYAYKDDVVGFFDMNAICKQRGFDGRPVVLAHKDFEKLLDKTKTDKKVELAYRTVGSGYEDRFKNDNNFYTGGVGQSVYGAGIYFASETDKATLKGVPPPPHTHSFSDSRNYGDITHYAIFPENFKWADAHDMNKEITALRNNQIPNPEHTKVQKEYEKVQHQHKAFIDNFADNIFKQHNYDKSLGQYFSQKHSTRDWKEADVHVLAGMVKNAGGVTSMQGQTMTIEMPKDAAGNVYKTNFTFTGNDGSHKYNTAVKGLYNNIYDNYVTPIVKKADISNAASDPTYKKLQSDLVAAQTKTANTPRLIANPNADPNDAAFLKLLDNHSAGNDVGLYAAYRGYDGIKATSTYRVIINRSKVIVSDKDY